MLPPRVSPFAVNNNNNNNNNNNINVFYSIRCIVLCRETEEWERVPILHFWRENYRKCNAPKFSAYRPLVLVKSYLRQGSTGVLIIP